MARRNSNTGFDFSRHMASLCRDMSRRVSKLSHIDVDHMLIAVSQTRKPVQHGVWASLTPMRFEGGQLTLVQNGSVYGCQRVYHATGVEVLYILRFYLPRFMDLPFFEKLSTVTHELWHVSPQFNGDIRRHAGRCYAHSNSQWTYDQRMQELTREWLSLAPPANLYEFLKLDFANLRAKYGSIFGIQVSHPKLIQIASPEQNG